MGDEAIQAMAVRGLLEHGVPIQESGFVYTRALLYTYLQAALIHVFDLTFNEFWLRFPGVLFGTLVIVPVYALARQFGDQRVALLSVLIIALSAWEIEVSRFARFYTLFQLAFVTCVYFFYRGFLRDQAGYRYAFLLGGFVAFFSHYLSLILFTLFFIPLFSGYSKERFRTIAAWGVALALLWYAHKYVKLWIGGMGQKVDTHRSIVAEGGEFWDFLSIFKVGLPNLYLPDWLPWLDLYGNQPLLLWVLILLSVSATVLIVVRSTAQTWPQVLLTSLAILCATVYQFGLVFLLLAMNILWLRTDWRGLLSDRVFRYGLIVCGLLFCFWLTVFMIHADNWKNIALTIFGVPNLLQYFVYWFVIGWPFLILVVGLTVLWLLSSFLADRNNISALYLPAVVLVPAVMASFFQSYNESRYVFHLYPAMVIMFALAMAACSDFVVCRLKLSRGPPRVIVIIGMLTVMLVLSQDANPVLSWRIADRDFQSVRDPMRSVISRPAYAGFHADRKSPSEYALIHRRKGDRVMTLGPIFVHAQYHYYTEGTDACLNPVNSPKAYGRWRDGILINYVTGAEILSGIEEIQEFFKKSPGTVWLLGDTLLFHSDNDYYSESVKKYLRELTDNPVVWGRDGFSILVRVNPEEQIRRRQDSG
jgi:hypothetical protein